MIASDKHYFDHDADIGIIGRGDNMEAAFVDGAYAMFALMANLSQVNPTKHISFEFIEADDELAFVTWLNLLLAKAHEFELIFSQFSIQRNQDHWYGTASGEMWHAGIERGIEVKGATLTMLSVKKANHHWEARCVVDV